MPWRVLLVILLLCTLVAPAARVAAQDQPSAVTADFLEQKAAAGDAQAAMGLADAYAEGKIVPGDPSKAEQYYRRALALGLPQAAYKLARLEANGNPQDAYDLLKNYRSAFEVAAKGDGQAMGNYLLVFASMARATERYAEALALDQENLDRAAEFYGSNIGRVALLKSNMAITLLRLGRAGESAQQLIEALPIYTRAYGANDTGVLNIYNNLAMAYEEMSRYEDAVAAYGKALALARRANNGNTVEVALQKSNLASALDRAGDSAQSEKLYREAVATIGAIEGASSIHYGRTLADMGTVLVSNGKYAEALDVERTALAVLQAQLGEKNSYVAAAHYAIGNILNTLDRWAESIPEYQQAVDLFSGIYGADAVEVATVRADMASAKTLVPGREQEAIADYQAALPGLEKSLGPKSDRVEILHNNLAFAYSQVKDYGKALAEQEQSDAISVEIYGPASTEVASGLINRASFSEQMGNRAEALRLLVRALPIYAAGQQRNGETVRKLYLNMARLLKHTGRPRAALLFAKLAINSHERLRGLNAGLSLDLGQSLAASLAPAYNLLVEQQIADGAFSQSQYVGSLIKSAEFAGLTSEGRFADAVTLTKTEQKLLDDIDAAAKPTRQAAESLRKRFAKLHGDGAALAVDAADDFDAKAAALSTTLDRLFAQAETDHAKWQADLLDQNGRQAAVVQKQLAAFGPGVALYQAISTDTALHLFVSAAGRETVHHQINIARGDLAKQVLDAVDAVEARTPDATAKLASLYDILLAPVADDLKQAKPGIVMLDLAGFLRYVPYAALQHNGHYLIEDYALALYTPAAHTRFAALAQSLPATAAGFGVTQAHGEFAALPGVAHELSAIFAGDGDGVLIGRPRIDGEFDAASFRAALKSHPRYVHIASHFKFVPGRENQSFLLLGNGDGLSMDMLGKDKGLQFRGVDLLTLSACETARGGGSEGEEVESFGALAQDAGASAVMATLWQIADASTAKLMADFYDGRVRHGLDKATALQRAQIAMLRGVPVTQIATRGGRGVTPVEDASAAPDAVLSTVHPFYWAAFILMGNWM